MTVYFAASRDRRRVKIGYVQDSDAAPDLPKVQRRLMQIVERQGERLDLLATAAGKRRVERWFHIRHSAAARGHEWFDMTPSLAADIAQLATGRPVDGQPPPWRRMHVRHYRAWSQMRGAVAGPYWLSVDGLKLFALSQAPCHMLPAVPQ